MTRGQRARREKHLERAADNMDKLELKRIKSFGKEKAVKERAKGWEDINGEGGGKKRVKSVVFEDGEGEGGELKRKKESGWVGEEEMDGVDGAVESKDDVVVPESVPLPVQEDELL